MLCPIMTAVEYMAYGQRYCFICFFGTTSLETESRNRLLVCSLLAGDATFVLLRCISCIWGFLKCRLDKV